MRQSASICWESDATILPEVWVHSKSQEEADMIATILIVLIVFLIAVAMWIVDDDYK